MHESPQKLPRKSPHPTPSRPSQQTPPAPPPASITELLHHSAHGESAALRELYARLYPEIKRVARARLAQVGGVTGLDTTALVHEGFLRMDDQAGLQGHTRGQFFAYVGQVLRSVVIDLVRGESRHKRGGDALHVTMSAAEHVAGAGSDMVELIALDRALTQMRDLDLPLYELIEMTAFAGVSLDEVASLRGVSKRSINRDLFKARVLLQTLMGDAPSTAEAAASPGSADVLPTSNPVGGER